MQNVQIPSGGKRPAQLRGGAQDFGKLGKISLLEGMAWAKIATYYYDFNRFNLPLTPAEVTQEFGRNIGVFNNAGDDPAGTRQTNAATGSGVNEAFVALGAGIVAMGEGEGFSINGVCVPREGASGDTPNVSVLQLDTPLGECYCGAVDLTNQPATSRLATFWWGAPTWRFIEKFFQAYRLQILINARFQIVDESLFDVGMTPVPPEFVGASDSRIPSMPFINATNGVMADKQIDRIFLPANTVESELAASACLPPPLAEVTYGHPRIIGLANRIYCFNQPILFIPGMRFEVDFLNNEDVNVYRALVNSITVNETTADAAYGDDTPDVAACGVSCTVPGGSVSLGVVFKGFALWPQACVEYLATYLVPNSVNASMYAESGSSYLNGLLGNSQYDEALRNTIAGNLGLKPNGRLAE